MPRKHWGNSVSQGFRGSWTVRTTKLLVQLHGMPVQFRHAAVRRQTRISDAARIRPGGFSFQSVAACGALLLSEHRSAHKPSFAGALSLYSPPGASARRRAHGLTRHARKWPLPAQGSTRRYNRFYADIVSLYYRTTKRRLQPHGAPHSAHTKITRLAIRQDGHYYTCQRRAIESTAHHSRRSSYHAQCCREHSTPRNGQSLKVE